jgi:hypothetical protein
MVGRSGIRLVEEALSKASTDTVIGFDDAYRAYHSHHSASLSSANMPRGTRAPRQTTYHAVHHLLKWEFHIAVPMQLLFSFTSSWVNSTPRSQPCRSQPTLYPSLIHPSNFIQRIPQQIIQFQVLPISRFQPPSRPQSSVSLAAYSPLAAS